MSLWLRLHNDREGFYLLRKGDRRPGLVFRIPLYSKTDFSDGRFEFCALHSFANELYSTSGAIAR